MSYGALLQTYALSKFLENLGHTVKVIDYQPMYDFLNFRGLTSKWYGMYPGNFVNLWQSFLFQRATRRWLPLTKKRYRTLGALQAHLSGFEAYICGSDQIWNPYFTNADSAYFCNFGEKSAKRIAYAGSFGTPSVPKDFYPLFKKHFGTLDAISSREESGCKLVQNISGRTCTWVLDPSLLLDAESYAPLFHNQRKIKSPYILVFSIQKSPLLGKVLDVVKATVPIRFVFVDNNWQGRRFWGKRYICCAPGTWLNLIASADAVVTNSFHGTAFAINFSKPFVSFGLTGDHKCKNTRITELLDALD